MTTATRIANDRLTVEVASLGAEMQSLRSADGRDWLWNGDASFWTGRSPVLFPIVGKAPGNRVEVDGVAHDMGQHGFARRSEFTLAASGPAMCRYELAASEATRAVYPFDFLLAITHALEGAALTVFAEVQNRGETPMPFGFGFHPAFLWPLPGAEGRDHTVTLDNGAEPALTRLDDGLVTQEKKPSPFTAGRLVLAHEQFADDAMIFAEGAGTGLTYAADGGPALQFSFENLPNVALWQKLNAPFLCVEPWHGMAAEAGASAELARRPYTTMLQPGATARFGFTVELRG